VLLPGLPGRERAAVLAHELAHEILHQAERRRAAELKRPGPARTRAERETEADATAYVVLAVLGIPSKAPTYIAWQGGTGLAVLRSMTRVQRAARAILLATR
jgi:antirestriction protein ArdC